MLEEKLYNSKEACKIIERLKVQATEGAIEQSINDFKQLLCRLEDDAEYLSVMIYTILGSLFTIKGNYPLALDHLSDGIEASRRYNMPIYEGKLFSNIGSLLVNTEGYATAEDFFRQSIELLTDIDDAETRQILILDKSSLGSCLIETGNLDEAAPIANELSSLPHKNDFVNASTYLFLAKYYDKVKDMEKAKQYIDYEIDYISNCTAPLLSSDDFQSFLRFLLITGRYEDFIRAYDIFKEIIEPMNIDSQNLFLTKILCRYYNEINDIDNLYPALKRLYEYEQLALETNRANELAALDFRLSFENIKHKQDELILENERLKVKASTDELTGIANRFGFNATFEEKFNYAYKNKKLIGVDFFDLDNFKSYNDTYGHLKGNTCLTKIATCLKSFSSVNIYPARYGGDEFIVLLTDMSVTEIEEFAKKLQDAVKDLCIPHTGSPNQKTITISQGISYLVPDGDIRSWDLLRDADVNLYRNKRKGKDGYVIDEYSYDEIAPEESGKQNIFLTLKK